MAGLHGDVRGRLRPGFAIEGFAFFIEAIFIGIYVYGWDRLSPARTSPCGIPIAIAGIIGSLMVISVNGWMNHPTGFQLVDGKAVDVHPCDALFATSYFWHELMHMYLAGLHGRRLPRRGRLRGGAPARATAGRYVRTALVDPADVAALAAPVQLSSATGRRARSREQPLKLAAMEGLPQTRRTRPCTSSAGLL